MGKRSLKASSSGTEIAKRAFDRMGWTQEYLAAEVGLSTRQSVWKFFSGRPIERHIFIDLCFQLNLDWQEIADLPQNHVAKSQELSTSKSTRQLDIEELVTIARSQLTDKIQAQCGSLRSSLELARPLQLEQIYTPVKVLTHLSHQRWLEVSDLQNSFSSSQRLSFAATGQTTISALDAIAHHAKLMILGKPGAGKTTFLQYLALQCISGKFQSQLLPVFISLRALAIAVQKTENFSFQDYIAQTWNCDALGVEQVEILLQKGKVLVLLDGLDEVSQSDKDRVLSQIQSFAETYYQNQIIITCRLAAHQYHFHGFTYVELADFDRTQVETFAKNWFIATAADSPESGLAKARQFIEQLQRRENLPLRELVVTPILLNLLCSVFQEKRSFPTKRSILYQEGLDILLVRWDRARGIHRDRTYRNLSLSDKIKLLSQIAASTFQRGEFFLEKSEILQIIADYLLTLPNINADPESLWLDSEAVLKAIEVQHGLLIERARNIYSFSHLTFQEYLTARKIVATPKPELDRSLQQLATRVTDEQWREVILLTVTMLPNTEILLQQMKQRVDSIIDSEPQLQQFLDFLDRKAHSLSGSYHPAAVRAFYFSLFLDRDLSLAIALDVKLARDLDKELALDLALARLLALSSALGKNPEFKEILNFNLALDIERRYQLNEQMQRAFESLKQQLPDLAAGKEFLVSWWQTNAQHWSEKFRQFICEYRYFNYHWNFKRSQQELLQKYYSANQFLVECLDSDRKVALSIEETIKTNILATRHITEVNR